MNIKKRNIRNLYELNFFMLCFLLLNLHGANAKNIREIKNVNISSYLEIDAIYQVQKFAVRGTVKDDFDFPLVGASVLLENSDRGVMTDENGDFFFEELSDGDILVVSYIGFKSSEIRVNSNQSNYQITLESDEIGLDEVVMVGYGTQKKSKLTGAISQVDSEVLQNRPLTNVAQGLQGVIPNLNISFGDGEPNRGGNFNIRGFTSINGGSPLILIDGTPGDINLINPDDVESVTVLKDAASAAIYGARAAFGVILIETKSGRGDKLNISFSSNLGISKPTRRPEILTDPIKAANIINEAYQGFSGNNAPGMLDIIDYLNQRKADPSLPELGVSPSGNFIPGGNTDWYDEFYNDSAPFFKNNLSISGSNEKTNYFFSLGHLKQQGIFAAATDDYERINLRLKLENKLSDWARVYVNTEYSKGVYDRPNKIVTESGYSVYRYLSLYAHPWNVIRTENGNYTLEGMSTFGQLEKAGRSNISDQMLKGTVGFKTKFLKDRLRVNGDYTVFLRQGRDDIQYNRLEYENRPNSIVQWTNPDYYRSAFAENIHQILNLYSEFENNFGNHHIKTLVGFNQEFFKSGRFYARRDNNLTSELQSLNLTTGNPLLGDNKYEWALRGAFGRLNYDYKDRYLLEINARYDGTSRFPKDTRFGFFPSLSLGWVLSQEEFLKPLFGDSNFKLRASYGSLGNQLVSNYAYINSMDVYTTGDILDGQQQLAVRAPSLTPFGLTWETTNTLNFGADVSLFNNKLQAGFDWYNRETKDMLTKGKTLPAVLGASEPQTNAADLSTKGWEFSLSWKDQIGAKNKFNYYANFVISDNKTTITKYDNPNKSLIDFYEGMELGEIWGYKTLGFFESDVEYLNHADQSKVQGIIYNFSGDGHPLAGDLKFEDRNSDGVIDFGQNTVDNPGDMYKIGNTTPRYSYGVNTGFNWGGFTFDALLQGVGKRDFWPGTESAVFWGFYNRWNQPVMKHIENNYWTPENPNAYFPRLRSYMALTEDRSLGAVQTRYLQNAAYLRLKNLSFGYTIPKEITTRFGVNRFHVFLAGSNLLEFTKISKAFDPEGINEDPDAGRSNGNGFVYPIQRTYTIGLELNL